MSASLSEAEEVRPDVYIAADQGKLDVLTGTALDFFTPEVHRTNFNSLGFHVFLNALVPRIEDLSDCCRGLTEEFPMRGGVVDLNDDLLANFEEVVKDERLGEVVNLMVGRCGFGLHEFLLRLIGFLKINLKMDERSIEVPEGEVDLHLL